MGCFNGLVPNNALLQRKLVGKSAEKGTIPALIYLSDSRFAKQSRQMQIKGRLAFLKVSLLALFTFLKVFSHNNFAFLKVFCIFAPERY
jgi:hypothetical protein